MKKGIVAVFLTFISVFCSALCLTACGIIPEPPHEHVFDRHNTDSKYLKSEATCTSTALYYYSCSCGEKGEEVFVNGKALGHIGGTATCSEPAVCERCGEKYGKPAAVGSHNYVDGACSYCDQSQTSGLTYNLSDDKTYYTVNKGVCSWETIHIRATYKGKPVKGIENNGFANSKNLKSIVIPDSVTSIGKGAFSGCLYLSDVKIPDKVTVIEGSVFEDCWSVTEFTIPRGVTSIGAFAFAKSGIRAITIPDSVKSIGNDAFSGCGAIKSVVIPDSVTDIGSRAFKGCRTIESVTLPSGLTSLGDGLFWGCSALADVTIPNTVTSIGASAFSDCVSLVSVAIPDSVKSIGDGAFARCSVLKSAIIPDSVTVIGDDVFMYCTGLTRVVIGKGVTKIGMFMFRNCEISFEICYTGSEEDWRNIDIDGGNDDLINATIRYNYLYENNG